MTENNFQTHDEIDLTCDRKEEDHISSQSNTETNTNWLWNLIPADWQTLLDFLNDSELIRNLSDRLQEEYKHHTVYPPKEMLFRALELCPVEKVKVVILGQDPYHAPDQANGLAFSCQQEPLQPSLGNIFKEIQRDFVHNTLNLNPELQKGDLTGWAEQGVLLLNTHLSVRRNQPGSHANLGWTILTYGILTSLSKGRVQYDLNRMQTIKPKNHLVFMLWGNQAHSAGLYIENEINHLILMSSHPSPFSYTKGSKSMVSFKECHHFEKCNQFFVKHNEQPIQWT